MLIRSPRAADVRSHEITPEPVFLRRRELLRGAALAAGSLFVPGCDGARGSAGAVAAGSSAAPAAAIAPDAPPPLDVSLRGRFGTDEAPTGWDDVTHYNNFYEFGTDKESPAERAHTLRPQPWSVAIEGEADAPVRVGLEDLLRPHPLEERIYRLRCVEGWSMVIPWVGFPLRDLLQRFGPGSRARYVEFRTLFDPEQMPGQRRNVLGWPYREALRIDEAMHPLSFLAVGLYGRVLPNQNGAPLRLVVPWKYGFKSIKSIVSIRFSAERPTTTWNEQAPEEYGFYANVNPEVDHPRWSQRRERRIGELSRRPTLPFNGYANEVASLYATLDLRREF